MKTFFRSTGYLDSLDEVKAYQIDAFCNAQINYLYLLHGDSWSCYSRDEVNAFEFEDILRATTITPLSKTSEPPYEITIHLEYDL